MKRRAKDIVGHNILYYCPLSQTEYKAWVVNEVDKHMVQVQVEGTTEGIYRYISLGQIKEVYDLPPMNL